MSQLMDIQEFKEKYLMEANRRFFHPLGLKLEVKPDHSLEIEDHREHGCGLKFGFDDKPEEIKEKFREMHAFVEEEFNKRKHKEIVV